MAVVFDRAVRRLDIDGREVPILDDSCSRKELRRLIAHGIVRSLARQPLPPSSFLFSVGLVSSGTSSIPATDLSELHTTRLGCAGTRAVLVSAIAGTADREVRTALAAPQESDRVVGIGLRSMLVTRPTGRTSVATGQRGYQNQRRHR